MFLIIGAGLSGVATAYHLPMTIPSRPQLSYQKLARYAQSQWDETVHLVLLSIMIIRILKPSSGHLMMTQGYVEKAIQEYGVEAATDLFTFKVDQIYVMKTVPRNKSWTVMRF